MREPGTSGRHDVAAAWLSALLLVPAFFAAFVVGEGLIGLLGYPVGGEAPPIGTGLLATIPALVVFGLPLWPTWHFGRRAAAEGHRWGRVPIILVAVVVIGFTVLNLVPLGQ